MSSIRFRAHTTRLFTLYPGIVDIKLSKLSKHFTLYRRSSTKIIMPSEDITDVTNANDSINADSHCNKRHRCDDKENDFKCKKSDIVLKFAKLSSNAMAPTRGSPLAAGFDLYSAYDYIVPAKGKEIVKTDIQIAVPDGCYGRVAPRSGLAAKNFIDVGAGVIDQDYRGNVGVVLFNFSDTEFKVNKGDRVAQLICERIYLPELVEAESLDETERGAGGFGSTGTN